MRKPIVNRSRALHDCVAHTPGSMRIHPPVSPLRKGGKETGRSVSILPPYEGGIQGGSSGASVECMQHNRKALEQTALHEPLHRERGRSDRIQRGLTIEETTAVDRPSSPAVDLMPRILGIRATRSLRKFLDSKGVLRVPERFGVASCTPERGVGAMWNPARRFHNPRNEPEPAVPPSPIAANEPGAVRIGRILLISSKNGSLRGRRNATNEPKPRQRACSPAVALSNRAERIRPRSPSADRAGVATRSGCSIDRGTVAPVS